MDDYIEAFFIRETEKARLLEIRGSEEQIWIPKSVTDYIRMDEIPDDLVGTIPGKPTLLKVAGWFRAKIADKL